MSIEIKKANLAKSQIDDRVGLHSVFMNSQHRENSACRKSYTKAGSKEKLQK